MQSRKIGFIFAVFVVLLSQICIVYAQLPVETPEQKKERMLWWTQDRFGMFIHWGLYAMPARHEWVKRYEHLTNEEYEKYFEMVILYFVVSSGRTFSMKFSALFCAVGSSE